MVKAIVCADKCYGIGKANSLLFNIPADMRHFKQETTGNICIFGYSTYMSLKKRPLPNRINVVLWDKAESMDCLEGAITFNDFNAMLNFVKAIEKDYTIYVCGGASIYKLMLPYTDLVDITFVNAIDPEATAFFPDLEREGFKKLFAEPYYKDSSTNDYSISKQIWAKN